MSDNGYLVVDYADPAYWRKWQARCSQGDTPTRIYKAPYKAPPVEIDEFGGVVPHLAAPDPYAVAPVGPGPRGPNKKMHHIFARVPKLSSPAGKGGRDPQNFTAYLSAPSSFGKQGRSTMATAGGASFSRATAGGGGPGGGGGGGQK